MVKGILEFVNQQYEGNDFYVKEFAKDLYFGKNSTNDIVCIKKSDTKSETNKIKTKYIELFQNVNTTLDLSDGNKLENLFDIIICKSVQNIDRETFVNLCFNFYNDEEKRDVISLTQSLINLFQIVSSKNTEFEKGLWGELFSVYFINKFYELDISNYWHTEPLLKYDFSFGPKSKMEVKATTRAERIHHFSHEQIYTSNKVLIMSILLKKDDSGLNVFELFESIKMLFDNNFEKIFEYEKELRKLNIDDVEKYALSYSEESAKFFLNDRIPRIESEEPEGVFYTNYDVDLSNIVELQADEALEFLNAGNSYE